MEANTGTTTPTYSSAVIGNLHILRWHQAPSIDDVSVVTREVERTAQSLGRTLVCIAIIPSSVEPPSDEARRRMLGDLDRFLELSEAVHFVIEGSGFKHMMLRSVVTGLILVAGRRGQIFVHSHADEAFREAAAILTQPVATIVATARAKGILT